MTLRIQRTADLDCVVFKLAGRINSEQIRPLRDLIRSEAADLGIVLDLQEVKLVDRDTVRFLAEIEAGGACLKNLSAFIRQWIQLERNAMQQAGASHPEADPQ